MTPHTTRLLVSLGAILIPGAVIAAEFRELGLALDSDTWPAVTGDVEESGVVSSMGTATGLSSMITFAPSVRYHYRVGDRQYVSDRIAFGGVVSTSLRSVAQRTADRFANHKTIKVYVSPNDPRVSVLEPGVHWAIWVALAIAAVILGLGVQSALAWLGLVSGAWL